MKNDGDAKKALRRRFVILFEAVEMGQDCPEIEQRLKRLLKYAGRNCGFRNLGCNEIDPQAVKDTTVWG